MDDLTALLGSMDQNRDLIDKFMGLIDRQTDHKLGPHILLGFLGLFNVLTIMSLVHNHSGTDIKEVSGTGAGDANPTGQSVIDKLSGMLNTQSAGQPDLMGLLSGLASKKKINPNLLLSLFSMLGNQTGPAVSAPVSQTSETPVTVNQEITVEKGEKKTPDSKQGTDLRYDRKRESGERS